MHGASRSVQRALGWMREDRAVERTRTEIAPCPECGARLRFDVVDPLGIGRSMQRCENAACANHRPHVMTPDPRPT